MILGGANGPIQVADETELERTLDHQETILMSKASRIT